MTKTPVQLLESELHKYVRAKMKSYKFHKEGKISDELHQTHMKNLNLIIDTYCDAIDILKKGLEERE